jgi:hypothetical protein
MTFSLQPMAALVRNYIPARHNENAMPARKIAFDIFDIDDALFR